MFHIVLLGILFVCLTLQFFCIIFVFLWDSCVWECVSLYVYVSHSLALFLLFCPILDYLFLFYYYSLDDWLFSKERQKRCEFRQER